MVKRSRRSSNEVTLNDWGEVVEAQQARLPDAKEIRRKRIMANAVLWGCLVTWPFLGLGVVSLIVANNQDQVATSTTAASSTDLAIGAAATSQMRAWLADPSSPLAGGSIVTTGAPSPVVYEVPKDSKGDPQVASAFTTWSVPFVLEDTAGAQFSSSVQVGLDPRGSVKAMSSPSLQAVAVTAADDWTSGAPWPGLFSSSPSESVSAAVEGWARAYVGGDPDVLRLAVGDPSASHYYVPLSGLDLSSVTAVKAAALDASGSVVTAQIEMTLTRPGVALDTTRSDPQAVTTFDVLVERANTAAPLVTAWGSAGSGPTLKRYGNAINGTGRPDPTPPSMSPSPSPSSSPSVTETPQ